MPTKDKQRFTCLEFFLKEKKKKKESPCTRRLYQENDILNIKFKLRTDFEYFAVCEYSAVLLNVVWELVTMLMYNCFKKETKLESNKMFQIVATQVNQLAQRKQSFVMHCKGWVKDRDHL